MNQKKKVIAAGHVCLDITPVFSKRGTVDLEQILTPGKLVLMDAADVHTGGSVANTGLAMKKFGMDVQLMGKVGKDSFGQMIQHIFSEHGAGEGLIVDEAATTSYSVVIAAPGNDRIFLHHPGANDTFISADIPEDSLEDVLLFHFGYPPLMKKMYEQQGKELIHLFQRMKSKGIMTSLDMAAIDPNSEAGKVDWKNLLKELLPYVDFFLPSVEELCFMLSPEHLKEWENRSAETDLTETLDVWTDVAPLGKELLTMGAKVVLIKCGAPGLYYCTAEAEAIQEVGRGFLADPDGWSDKEGFEKSYQPDRVLSATGAGDTTIAAFLSAMLEQRSLNDCLKLATATGASNVTEYDALSGLKSFEELEEKIRNGWKKG